MSTENDVDSLKVTENDDGTFTVEWDPEDPRYSFLNGLTEEQINDILTRGLMEQIERWDSENESQTS